MTTLPGKERRATKTGSSGSGRVNLAVFFFFLLVSLAAYWSILGNALIGDDFFYTVKGGELSFSGLWHLFDMHPSFVRPLPSLVFWLQFKAFGVDGTPSHLINVAIHAGNAFLLFWLLKRLSVSEYAAFLGSFLFLIAPIAVEPVTWSTGRFDLMSTFFILLAVGLYLISVQHKDKAVSAAFIGALFAAFASMFSKESAMILVIIFPVIELLYGVFAQGVKSRDNSWRNRLRASGVRLLVFYAAFVVYVAIRYASLGRFGGYKHVPMLSMPQPMTAVRTAWTFLAPVSSLMASRTFIIVIGAIFLILLAVSQGLVLLRWRSARKAVRTAWVLLVALLVTALIPVNTQLFSFGIHHDLKDSRELYIVTALTVSLMVIGLFEFGWKEKAGRLMATVAILLLAIPWLYGISRNNEPWIASAAISHTILEDTRNLVPDPPTGARFYFVGIPEWENGAYVYITALKHAVADKYGRKDLETVQIRQDDTFNIDETADGYLFVYDPGQKKVMLEHEPRT